MTYEFETRYKDTIGKTTFIEHLTEDQQMELFKVMKENWVPKLKMVQTMDIRRT